MERERWASGTATTTVKLWDHIDRNPGCTLDDLVAMAAEDAVIPIGARRAYAKQLTLHDRRSDERAGRSARSSPPRHPRDVDEQKAINHVVVTRLRAMRRFGSIRRDEDGRYFTARPIRRTGPGAIVQSPEDVRADIAERFALIAFRKYRDKHPDGKSFMPVALFNALSTWHDAHRREYFEGQARRAQNGDAESPASS